MPFKCCVPGCKGNYNSGPKVQVFSFPNEENLRKKWIISIPRKDFVPTKNSKVCKLHFADEDIISQTAAVHDSQTGEVVNIPLLNIRLKKDAVPCKFRNCPDYFSKYTKKRKSRDEKLEEIDNKNLKIAKKQSEQECIDYIKSISFSDFDDLIQILNKQFTVPENWHRITEK